MVVLPEPVRVAARRHPLLRGLLPTDAGYFPTARGHLVERPAGAPTDLVIVCLRGAGWVRVGGETMAVEAGGHVWLKAQNGHAYGADERVPWTIVWAHFTGDEVDAWRALHGIPPEAACRVGRLPADRLGEVALDRVHAALERGYATRDLVAAAAALRTSLAAIERLAMVREGMRPARDRVASSIEALRRDWARPHRLEELASAAGLSTAHYSTLFRQQTGFAPIDYLIRLRIQHACRLLDTTTLSVAEVAVEVGYEDAFYFTRCFRRVMGRSPRAYRGVPKG
jgi:AraC family transcriptional regulator, arabinose operon regulatory protein